MTTWTATTETLRSTQIARIFSSGQLTLHVDGCEIAARLLATGGKVTQRLANESRFGGNFAQQVADRFPHEATCACLPDNLRLECSTIPPAPIVDTPEIVEAVRVLRLALEWREQARTAMVAAQGARDACRTGAGSRTARTRAGQALEVFNLADDDVARNRAWVERAVRSANAYRGCTEPQLNAAADALA